MTKRGTVHSLEDYLELYARLELEPEDFLDEDTFRDKLRSQLWYEPSQSQFEAQSILRDVGVERLASVGVKPKYIPTIAVGTPIRYYIKGYRGGFGWPKAQTIWAELAGRPW